MGKRENLPKWAQLEITRLEGAVEDWKVKATAGPENSNTFVRNFGHDDTPLGDSPRVVFKMEGTAGRRDEITVHLTDGRLRVSGDRAVQIMPSASNSIYVEMEN